MNEKNKIDVIIPTKNSASTIEDCLKSLKNQNPPVNIIIVDARSSDDTLKIALKYTRHIYLEPYKWGLKGSRRAVALNEGLKHSYSKIVAFIDSDTIVPEGWSSLSKYLSRESGVVGVTSGCQWNDKDKKGFSYACHLISKIGSSHAKSFTETTEVKSIPGYNSLYLRSALTEVGGFDESIGGCEDFDLNHRLRERGWVLLGVAEYPVEHRCHHTFSSWWNQMWGYAWSRGRLLKVKKHFSLLHSLPSISLLSLIVLTLLYPPVEFTFFKSILTSPYPHFLTEKLIETYFFIIGLWSYVLIIENFSFVLWLKTILSFLLQHLAWSLGYIKGLID